MWTIPVHRKSSRPRKHPGRPKAPVASPEKPQWRRHTKDWDNHDKYKLSPLEQDWRKAQRVSKHYASHYSQSHGQHDAEALNEHYEYDASSLHRGRAQPHALPLQQQQQEEEEEEETAYDSEGSTEAPSLTDMRNFINRLQHKYSISPSKPPSAAQQKLAQLRRETAVAGRSQAAAQQRQGAYSDNESGEGSEVGMHVAEALGRQQPVSVLPAAASRAADEQKDLCWGEVNIFCCEEEELAAAAACSSRTPHQAMAVDVAALDARLVAAEAKLKKYEATLQELLQVRQQLEELTTQHASLRSDVDDFVGHTSTLLTSLQTTMSSFLAGSGNRPSSPQPKLSTDDRGPELLACADGAGGLPSVAPATAAFRAFRLSQQQAAAAQAAAVQMAAQAACGQGAAGATGPASLQLSQAPRPWALQSQPLPPRPQACATEAAAQQQLSSLEALDMLTEVQLPSFSQRFSIEASASMSRPGSVQQPDLPAMAGSVELPKVAAAAVPDASSGVSGLSVQGSGCPVEVTIDGFRTRAPNAGGENQPPRPRPLPPIFAASSSPAVAGPMADFEWWPCSAST